MATAYEVIQKSVFGNKNVRVVSMSIDAASANIDTGLSVVEWFSVAPISMTTTALSFKKNIGSNSTSRPGFINVNSAVSGDVFYVVAFGR